MTAERSEPARVPPSARVVRVPLAMDKSPSTVLRAAGRDARPFALFGSWSGASALVGSEPLLVVEDAADPFAVFDRQPEITATIPGATGGGWVGYLGYGLGRVAERPRPPPHHSRCDWGRLGRVPGVRPGTPGRAAPAPATPSCAVAELDTRLLRP